MSEAVKDMISQALDQDFNNANKTFNDVMTIKLTDLLDQEQVRLADNIYNGGADDGDEDDIMGDEDGDQLELDLETEDDDEESEEDEEMSDTDDADEDLDWDDDKDDDEENEEE